MSTRCWSGPWALGVGPLAPGLTRQELGLLRDRFISSSYAPIVSHDMPLLRAALECFGPRLFALGGLLARVLSRIRNVLCVDRLWISLLTRQALDAATDGHLLDRL